MTMMNAKQKKRRQYTVLIILSLFVLIIMAWSMTVGEFKMSSSVFFKTLFGFGEETDTMVLFEFRMPRLIVTLLCGASLSLSGAILQSITKNPLADPGIIGINAGSGFMIVLLILVMPVDSDTFIYMLPLFSMIGGLMTAVLIFSLSYKIGEGIQPVRMILMGVGIATALSGASILITSAFKKEQVEFVSAWLAGNIWGDTWPFVMMIAVILSAMIPFIMMKSNVLNILNTHEHVSTGIGLKVNQERIILMLVSVILSAAAVAVCGAIGFVGLLGPHIARSLTGPRHQAFLPAALLIGAVLLGASDTLGRALTQPAGIPAGVIVSIIGAPYFLYLMRKGIT